MKQEEVLGFLALFARIVQYLQSIVHTEMESEMNLAFDNSQPTGPHFLCLFDAIHGVN